MRSARTSDVATSAGQGVGERIGSAIDDLLSLNLADRTVDFMLGVLLVGALLIAVNARDKERVALLGATGALGVRLMSGLAFVTGLAGVLPLAVVGAARGLRITGARALVVVALAAMPLVWFTQYTTVRGGDWGPRYLLISAALLLVVGVRVLDDASVAVRRVVVGLCVATTLSGVAYLGVRSRQGSDLGQAIVDLPEDAVVSTEPFLFREIGSRYSAERHWLTVGPEGDLDAVARILRNAGDATVALLGAATEPPELRWYEPVGQSSLDAFGTRLTVWHYVLRPIEGA
jgi:hypothetical protein